MLARSVRGGYTSNCVTFNSLNAELIYIMYKNLCRTSQRTLRFNYKDQSVSAVRGNNPCLL